MRRLRSRLRMRGFKMERPSADRDLLLASLHGPGYLPAAEHLPDVAQVGEGKEMLNPAAASISSSQLASATSGRLDSTASAAETVAEPVAPRKQTDLDVLRKELIQDFCDLDRQLLNGQLLDARLHWLLSEVTTSLNEEELTALAASIAFTLRGLERGHAFDHAHTPRIQEHLRSFFAERRLCPEWRPLGRWFACTAEKRCRQMQNILSVAAALFAGYLLGAVITLA